MNVPWWMKKCDGRVGTRQSASASQYFVYLLSLTAAVASQVSYLMYWYSIDRVKKSIAEGFHGLFRLRKKKLSLGNKRTLLDNACCCQFILYSLFNEQCKYFNHGIDDFYEMVIYPWMMWDTEPQMNVSYFKLKRMIRMRWPAFQSSITLFGEWKHLATKPNTIASFMNPYKMTHSIWSEENPFFRFYIDCKQKRPFEKYFPHLIDFIIKRRSSNACVYMWNSLRNYLWRRSVG